RIDHEELTQLAERYSHLDVERRNRHWPHCNLADISVAHAQPNDVLDEIELDLQTPAVTGHRRSRQPPSRHVKGDMPRMIEPWRQREPDLADNLRPQMQRVARVPPGRQGQLRPAIRCHVSPSLNV